MHQLYSSPLLKQRRELHEQLLQLLAANLRINRSELDEIDADIGLEIMLAFIGTNIDFFTKRVAPMLKSKLSNTPGH